MEPDRRDDLRVEWHSPAMIYDRNGLRGRRCVLSNLSNGGARLIVAQPDLVPAECTLRITPESSLRHCHVIWRSNEGVGVEFLPSPNADALPNPELIALRRGSEDGSESLRSRHRRFQKRH